MHLNSNFYNNMFIFFFLLHQTFAAAAVTYLNCEPVNWSDATVTFPTLCENVVTSIGQTWSFTDFGQHRWNATFNKSKADGLIVQYTSPFNMRVDSFSSLWFHANLSMLELSLIKFKWTLFMNFQGLTQNTSQQAIEVLIKAFGLGASSTPYFVEGVPYAYHGQHFWKMRELDNSDFALKVDVMEFMKLLIKLNAISRTDKITTVIQQWLLTGKGWVGHIVQVKPEIRNSSFNEVVVGLKDFTFSTDLPYGYADGSTDLSNITVLTQNPLFPSDLISNFQFYTKVRLNAYHCVTVGYLNDTWMTPIHQFGIPFLLNTTNETIRMTFSYSVWNEHDLKSQLAACMVGIIRKDYNPTAAALQDKFQSITYPSTEVYICPYWSYFLKPTGKHIKKINVDGILYEVYSGSSCLNSSKCWPTFTFASFSKVTDTQDLNVIGFISTIYDSRPETSSETLAAIQGGFRFYVGKSMMQFNGITIRKSNQTSFNYFEVKSTPLLSDALANILLTSVSIPNLSLLLRMVSLLRIIDDLAYYTYHLSYYDQRFSIVSELCWNLTNTKWMIPELRPVYDKFNISYNDLLPVPHIIHTPMKFIELDGSSHFLIQTQEYWLSTVPISILSFGGFYLVFKLLVSFEFTNRFSHSLIKFKWPVFLLVNLIGENVQYLSFRCFSQTYQVSAGNRLEILNLFCCYVALFVVVFYASSWFVLFGTLPKQAKEVVCEGFRCSLRTAAHFSALSSIRVFTGFMHSKFADDGQIQVSTLLSSQILILVLIVANRQVYTSKSLLACHVCEYIFRILLHFGIAMEVVMEYNFRPKLIQDMFNSTSETLFAIIFSLCVLDFIINSIPSFEAVADPASANKTETTEKSISDKNQATAGDQKYVEARKNKPAHKVHINFVANIKISANPVNYSYLNSVFLKTIRTMRQHAQNLELHQYNSNQNSEKSQRIQIEIKRKPKQYVKTKAVKKQHQISAHRQNAIGINHKKPLKT